MDEVLPKNKIPEERVIFKDNWLLKKEGIQPTTFEQLNNSGREEIFQKYTTQSLALKAQKPFSMF